MSHGRTVSVVVAGGSSRRMGFDKLAAPLLGKPVLRWSVEAFAGHPLVDAVLLVGHPERLDAFGRILDGVGKLVGIIPGGAERHLSVWQALKFLNGGDCGLVAVHDGARPLIAQADIAACLGRAAELGAAACARRVTETLQRGDDGGFVVGDLVDRRGLWAMETPQAFRYDNLFAAYEAMIHAGDSATDETSVIRRAGGRVGLVESTALNLKITIPSDLALAEAWLKVKSAA